VSPRRSVAIRMEPAACADTTRLCHTACCRHPAGRLAPAAGALGWYGCNWMVACLEGICVIPWPSSSDVTSAGVALNCVVGAGICLAEWVGRSQQLPQRTY
jgi:hypothetical protein